MPSRTNTTDRAPPMRRFKRGYRWGGVELEPYKLDTDHGTEFRGASRQVLIGKRGEQVNFHVRYFELEPGGFTTLERHQHSHVVIGVRGRGRIRVGARQFLIGALDTVYVGPNEPHQLRSIGRAKFGFLCMVNAERDKPIPLSEAKPVKRDRPMGLRGRS
ncbi:MAG TPA: cupin domain-containing protein [Candidatus Binataceae bacterium]|nr:cupin domain-containing protein [Candidatus Binataceae bacterium]